MYSYDKLSDSLTSNKYRHIDDPINLSCVCCAMNCCCCTTNNRNRYTPADIQEQFDNLTDVNSLKKNQMPHAKICLEERQFTRPSPALRYAKIPRRKLSSASEPMLFGLPIQYGNNSVNWKKLSMEGFCEWPFTGLSEYLRSYRPYRIDEIQLHRGKRSFKEQHFQVKDLEPMARFTTYTKAYQNPRSFDEKVDCSSDLLKFDKC